MKHWRSNFVAGFALVVSLTALTGVRAQDSKPKAEAPAGNVENGKKNFKTVGCYQCHGFAGQGAPAAGPRIAPPTLAFAAFKDYIRQPKNQMPTYTAKVLSDSELADIYAFLQTKQKPPAAKTIPLLSP